jgi:methyl-accepting chemotaxis protein WspA
MKKKTIGQRLHKSFAILFILLMTGVAAAWWVHYTCLRTSERSERLDGLAERMRRDVTHLGDLVRLSRARGDLGEAEGRINELGTDITNTAAIFKLEYGEYGGLLNAVEGLNKHVAELIRLHENAVKELSETNPATAGARNVNGFAALAEPPRLFAGFSDEIRKAQADEENIKAWTALIGGAVVLIVLVACLVVGRRQSTVISVPLTTLADALERMRRGDFTQRVNVDGDDEFGILGQGFNRVAADLSALVGQVQRSGIQVNTTATQIAATAREQQGTANQIAVTTAEIGATSKEISATSRELVNTMNEVSTVAVETAKLAGSGQDAIARMEATMRQLMDASASISAKLAALSEKTGNINSVVTTITKVADQTNLLSLNAAIEAEKAGEYGLGFAVVAVEIRRLADQTAVATYDIEKMVKEMQSAVAAGVMGMDRFSDEVRRGVEEVRQVSAQLAQIIHQVQKLTPTFQTVNEGMQSQATGAQQISETLTGLSEAAQQTAESLRQSNLAIDQLNDAARGLQTAIARFKLGI